MTEHNSAAFFFDDVRVEPATFQAFKAGNAIQLEPKALSLLLFLIENRGRLIEKEEILDTVWKGTHVTENALAREIGKLRKTLRDDPKASRYIQTVHTRGYRFIAEVKSGNGDLREASESRAGAASKDFQNADLHSAPLASSSPRTSTEGSPSKPVYSHHRSWIAIAVLAVTGILVLVSILLWQRGGKTEVASPNAATTTVAVLPFKIVASGKGDEYLGVELADALINRLGNSTRLSVSPITSALHYAEMNQDPRAIGNLMKVDYVLYGEIDRSRQHMTTQLVRVRDGVSLLAESYDEKFDDIFQLEDTLCGKVLGNLLVTLNHEELQRVHKRFTDNQQAYETFLKAHYFMNKATKEDTYRGIQQFQQAIDLDPKYAMAYAGLSDCYMRLGRYGVAPSEFLPPSRAAVMKALEADETVAYAHSMLGRISFQYDWDFSRANREYTRARELEPKLVHSWYGFYLLALNRVAEAEAEHKKFEEFLPFATGSALAQHLYFSRQYDPAVHLLNKKLESNPDVPLLHEWLGLVYEQQGRSREAIDEFQKAINLSHGVDGVGALGHVYAVSGRFSDAETTLRKLNDLSKHIYVSPYQKAVIYAGLGKKDEALRLLEKAYGERSLSPTSLRYDPRLNELRADPRFQDFIRRTGMPL